MAETKKNNTAKKANTTKSANTTKKANSNKPKTTNTKKSNVNKNNTNKKVNSNNKNVKKNNNTKKATPKKIVKETKNIPLTEEIEVIKPKVVEEATIENVEIKEVPENIHMMSEPVIEEKQEKIEMPVTKEEKSKKDKTIDLGILVVVIGLFILVVTTYLTSSMGISEILTKTLVIISLLTEAVGIGVIIYGSIKKW